MQNKVPDQIIGAREAPFLNRLITSCGVATNYHWVWHAAFPPATSGEGRALTRGCLPAADCKLDSESIFSQLGSAGQTWRTFVEDMPANCSPHATNLYAPTHNPPIYYTKLAKDCQSFDVPMGTLSSGAFAQELASDHPANFIWALPNACNDMHDCSISVGDAWLERWITRIVSGRAYQRGDIAIFITWDESGNDPPKGDDCSASADPECLVPLVVVTPSTVPGTRSAELFSHYSLLRTTEELLGIKQLLGNARNAASLRAAFHL
jgi:hypothetical protein